MKQNYRLLAISCFIAAICLGSCLKITDELNLDKDVSLDMQIGRGGLSIPIGSLSRIYLDSLIKTDGDESVLDTLGDGLFGFSMDGEIDKVEVNIGDVTINIPKPDINEITASFDQADVNDTIKIDRMSKNTVIQITPIDLDAINNRLPTLNTSYSTKNDNPIHVNIPEYLIGMETPANLIPPIVVGEEEEKEVHCNFSYDPPKDVAFLNTVYLGDPDGTVNGQVITLDVDLSSFFAVSNNPTIRINYMDIKFPSEFTILKDTALNKYIDPVSVSVVDSVFSISDALIKCENIGNDHILPVSLIVSEVDFSEYPHKIDFNKSIKYRLSLNVSFVCTESGEKDLYIDVSMNNKLMMRDFSVSTNKKALSLPSGNVGSSFSVTGLENLSEVNYIEFDETQSVLKLYISDFNLENFAFDDSSAITLQFPYGLVFVQNEDGNVYVGETPVGKWVENSNNTLELWPGAASGNTISLYVSRLNINKTVDEVTKEIIIDNNVSYSGNVSIKANPHVNKDALDELEDKDIGFSVWGDLYVSNANVVTSSIDTEINEETAISIDEEIDQALVALSKIDLTNPAGAQIQLKFKGVPETFTTLTFTNFTVEFPKFLNIRYYGNDNARINVQDNKLIVNGNLNRYELDDDGDGFQITGFKILGMSFDPVLEITDGHIKLDDTVRISGKVTVPNQTLNSEDVKDIRVTPIVEFDPVVVKSVTGKVNPKIDEIQEEIDLDLGDDLDFFKDDDNHLSLSDPQITINLESTVTVPINIEMALLSKDSHGNPISDTIRPDDRIIKLGMCDTNSTSRRTTIVIYKNYRPLSESQDTLFVRISHLDSLMSPVPDKILFNLVASVDQSVDHYIDLTRELAVSGDYKVSIPLSFDSLYIEYSDTISNLAESLEDIGDKIDETVILLQADIKSTIPLGVSLTAKALDKNNNPLTGLIDIDSCLIGAGNEQGRESRMNLKVDVKKGALSRLESIEFTAACQSASDTDVSIKKGQYIDISNLRLKLPEGLKVDLTDEINKKDKK